jgi:hypothetical protein
MDTIGVKTLQNQGLTRTGATFDLKNVQAKFMMQSCEFSPPQRRRQWRRMRQQLLQGYQKVTAVTMTTTTTADADADTDARSSSSSCRSSSGATARGGEY